jgi:hypothetical protein
VGSAAIGPRHVGQRCPAELGPANITAPIAIVTGVESLATVLDLVECETKDFLGPHAGSLGEQRRELGRPVAGEHLGEHLGERAPSPHEIIAAIEHTVRETGAHRLILCASPRMLGELRALDLRREGLVIDELPRDYVKFTPPQIHELLVEHGLLPESPPRPGLAHEA